MTTATIVLAGDGRLAFVVDDDRRVRSLLSKVLASVGFRSQLFSRVSDVEAALTVQKPDIIILDLSLGGSDAIEMMRSLEAAHFTGSIMLISGHGPVTLAEVQKIGERHGLAMLPFMTKPFHLADLKRELSSVARVPKVGDLGGDLLTALENNLLQLWYQPKIDLRTRAICGAEALVRINHPELGILTPVSFLPPPGDPLFRPLTNWVIRRSLSDWPQFDAAGLPIRLAINVPASELLRRELVGEIRGHLPASSSFPGLIVEITEDEALGDPEAAREAAIQLKLYGIHVSIDDFGTGFSTLSRLEELPFAELKLDRRYVDGCASDERKLSICKGVVDLAHRYGITAVAEGVETAPDLVALAELGYDVAQGYFFAKPLVLGDFLALPTIAGPDAP